MITDFIHNDDLETRDGDLLLEESEQLHIKDITFANKGEYRQHGLAGIGILKVLNGNETIDSIRKRITLGLNFDNFDVEDISIQEEDDIRIIAHQKIDV